MARYRAGLVTEARILQATRELLSEVGLDGTTLALICERASVRPGSFYNLFDSKEEAVLKVVAQAIAALDPTHPGEEADDPADLVEAYISFVTGSPELARIYLQIAVTGALDAGGLHERVLRQHRRRVARFGAALAEASMVEPAAADRASETLLAALNGLAFRSMLDDEFDFAGHARRLLTSEVPSIRR